MTECDFSEYKEIRLLGQGNQGKVVLVEKEGIKYAKKTFDLSNPRTELGFNRYNLIESYESEVQTLRSLNHSNFTTNLICSEKVDDDSKTLSFIMEFVDGKTWQEDEILHGTLQTHKKIFAKIIFAFEELRKHRVSIVDLKPENIMITKNGVLKMIDFGGARSYGQEIIASNKLFSDFTSETANEAYDWHGYGALLWFMNGVTSGYKNKASNEQLMNLITPFTLEFYKTLVTFGTLSLDTKFGDLFQESCPKYIETELCHLAKDTILLSHNKLSERYWREIRPNDRFGFNDDDIQNLKQHNYFSSIKDWNAIKQNEPDCDSEDYLVVNKPDNGSSESIFIAVAVIMSLGFLLLVYLMIRKKRKTVERSRNQPPLPSAHYSTRAPPLQHPNMRAQH